MADSERRLAEWVALAESVLLPLHHAGIEEELKAGSGSTALTALSLLARHHEQATGKNFGYAPAILEQLPGEPAAATERGALLLAQAQAALRIAGLVQLSQWADHVWEYREDLEKIRRDVAEWIRSRD